MSSRSSVPDSSFEQELNRLQGIVAQLESGELSLEATVSAFQQGSELVSRCQRLIADAELRITKLADAPTVGSDDAPGSSNGERHHQLSGL